MKTFTSDSFMILYGQKSLLRKLSQKTFSIIVVVKLFYLLGSLISRIIEYEAHFICLPSGARKTFKKRIFVFMVFSQYSYFDSF